MAKVQCFSRQQHSQGAVHCMSRFMRALVAGAVQMLEQGFSADSADYDGRTALMLCAGKGHTGAQCPGCAMPCASCLPRIMPVRWSTSNMVLLSSDQPSLLMLQLWALAMCGLAEMSLAALVLILGLELAPEPVSSLLQAETPTFLSSSCSLR